MIHFVQGNIFDSGCGALVNPVNCVGIMGKGLALQFKHRFPANFVAYAEACRRRELVPGHLHVFEAGASAPHLIVNFPTKRHWRDASRLDDIALGLNALAAAIASHGIRSLAIPPLGCGLGGLPWPEVRSLILRHLHPCDHTEIVVYGSAPL
ncbi:MAG: macro domain-containing protein [Alphaproteobacteria bacterium]|nr:macro domain-containing protein [Alphaproteobacteria bacterium]